MFVFASDGAQGQSRFGRLPVQLLDSLLEHVESLFAGQSILALLCPNSSGLHSAFVGSYKHLPDIVLDHLLLVFQHPVQQLRGIVQYDVLSLQLSESLLGCESHVTPWHFIPLRKCKLIHSEAKSVILNSFVATSHDCACPIEDEQSKAVNRQTAGNNFSLFMGRANNVTRAIKPKAA
jgi:hypothetical protein